MYAQVASNAAVKNGLVGLAICGGLSRQGTRLLVAISSLERKAPGENLFVEGDERNDACLRPRWEGMETMITSRKTMGKQVLKYAIASIAVSCLGAAVFAAPMTITPRRNQAMRPSARVRRSNWVAPHRARMKIASESLAGWVPMGVSM